MEEGVIQPGATIGIFGGGQLGRMIILAGRRLGYRFRVFDPSPNACALPLVEEPFTNDYSERYQIERFARGCDVITVEFENVPRAALNFASHFAPVRPSADAVAICQHRLREKTFLQNHGFPCAPFAEVNSAATLADALKALGRPALLKSAAFGYDGKGQVRIEKNTDPAQAWQELGVPQGVLESLIDFAGEFSVIVARTVSGKTSTFPLTKNVHRGGILHTSTVPALMPPAVSRDPQALATEAAELALAIAEKLDLVGLLAVEFFLTREGAWLVNELAPRPHNSGHWTFDAAVTSQFEQHLRAICGLPLGDPSALGPVTMTNLLGDIWFPPGASGPVEPDWRAYLQNPRAKLHLYDKGAPQRGRKMGHLTELA